MNNLFTYGLNEPEPDFCWTTHEFGLTVPIRSKIIVYIQTMNREGHALHCHSELAGSQCFEFSNGPQAVAFENPDDKPMQVHCLIEPRISIPSDVRDLGIIVVKVEQSSSGVATFPGLSRLLESKSSSFRPPAPINTPATLATGLLRNFAGDGFLSARILARNHETFKLAFSFCPPDGTSAPPSLTFKINREARVTVPVSTHAKTSPSNPGFKPDPFVSGVLDCSSFLERYGGSLDIELDWGKNDAFLYQSFHWRGPGRGAMPHPVNIERVAGAAIHPDAFAFGGATWLVKLERLYRQLTGHALGTTPVLDWGCGCGRIARFLPDDAARNLHGVDIDAVNIEWCKHHYDTGTFTKIDIDPPMHYDDDFFGVIYGHSVLTHLGERDQFAWLNELSRVLAPGGLAFLTVLAELSWFIRFFPNRRTPESIAKFIHNGFIDDGWLNVGVDAASTGRYRSVSHTTEYILREWSRYFEVIDLIPGFADLQTLVVLRKR